MAINTCREEFRIGSFLLRHNQEEVFYTSPWLGTQVAFLVYRLTVASFCLGFLMWLLAKYAATENYFFYATYYGFYILTGYFLCSAVVTCVGLSRARSFVQPTDTDRDQETAHQSSQEGGNVTTQNNLRWFHQVQWLLMNMAFSPAIIITIGFTGFLSDGQYNFKDLTTHILNTVLVLVDVFVCGVPVRVLHAIYPVMFGFAYTVIYAVSWAATGTAVYWFLDFSKPAISSAAVLGFVLVALPLFHLLFYGLYLLRCRLLKWLSGGKTPAPRTHPRRTAPV